MKLYQQICSALSWFLILVVALIGSGLVCRCLYAVWEIGWRAPIRFVP